MITNEFISWRRRWGRVVPVGDVIAEPDRAGAVDQPDAASAHADRDALLAELARLPRRQQAVLVLRYYEGLTDAEIAELLDCRRATVRGYASRALAALHSAAAETQTALVWRAGDDQPVAQVNVWRPGSNQDLQGHRLFGAEPVEVHGPPARSGDLTVELVDQNLGAAWSHRSSVLLVSGDSPPVLIISVAEGPPGDQPDENWAWEATTIAGRPARCSDDGGGRHCEVDFGAFTVGLDGPDLNAAWIDRLVAGMHFATVNDPSTWYNVDEAFPGP